jgi:UDP-galactopyranose mutase
MENLSLMNELPHYSTVILGAGLCGLSAAYHLEEKGISDYLILERDFKVGGLARTETFEGFSFDHAIHVWYSGDPYAEKLICHKLLQGNLLKQTRRSYCYSAGVYTEYPYQLNLHRLPPQIIHENIMGLIEARYQPLQDEPPLHLEAWIYRTFGQGIAENFMIPYNRRQWAWNLKEMNYDWIADRVPMPDISEVLRGALQPQRKKYGSNQIFWYPAEGGVESLPRAFLRCIPPERFWLNASVAAIDNQRREIFLADGRRVRYDRVISTMPLPALIHHLGDAVPAKVRESGAGLKHNVVHVVNIGLEGQDFDIEDLMHWVYFPDDKTIFHRVSFPSNLAQSMVPPGCSSIQMEISESVQHRRDRSAMGRQSLKDLVKVGILKENDARPVPDGGRVRVSQVFTIDPAYIIYDLNQRENTRIIHEYLVNCGIISKGRFGEWEYLNMDHAILSGKAAADEIAGG